MKKIKFKFFLVIVIFLFYFLTFAGKVWFDHDDFDFLFFSSQFSPNELLRPHNEHFLPVFRLLFFLEYSLFKLNAQFYFAVSILLHIVSILLIYKIVFYITKKDFWAYSGAILYSINATFYESIIWITSQQTLLCGLFLLASYLTYLYFRIQKKAYQLYLSCFFSVLSAFSFGIGLIAPAFFFAMSLFDKKSTSKARFLYFLSSLISFIAFFIFSVSKYPNLNHIFSLKVFAKMAVFFVTGFTQGLLNRFFWAGFTPSRVADSDLLLMPILTIAVFFIIFKITWSGRKKKKDWFLDISLALLTLLPYAVIALSRFPGGFKGAMAERYTYLPLAFFIIFLVYELQLICKSTQLRFLVIFFICWIIITQTIYLRIKAFTWLKQPEQSKIYMSYLQGQIIKGLVNQNCTIPLYINTRPDPCLRYAKILSVQKID